MDSSHVRLGLGDPPIRTYLYVAQDESDSASCWYKFDHDSKAKLPVQQRALTGYISGLKLHETSGKFGKKEKLDILMDCGPAGPYAIRSGLSTTFSRGIILALITIEDKETLLEPLTIVVSPSKDNTKIVFGAVYIAATGQRVKFDWDKEADLHDLVRVLQSVVGDGGSIDTETDQEEHGASHGSDHREPPPRTGHPSSLANNAQIQELKRVGASVGFVGEDQQLDIDWLNRECQKHYPDAATIEQLTVAEAIEFRQTLMSM